MISTALETLSDVELDRLIAEKTASAKTAVTTPAEKAFKSWYQVWANKTGIDPNPDNPLHKYDYRAAHKAGATPSISKDDGKYHWPSEFKSDDHPNRFVNGVDTKTGIPKDAVKLSKLSDADLDAYITSRQTQLQSTSGLDPMSKFRDIPSGPAQRPSIALPLSGASLKSMPQDKPIILQPEDVKVTPDEFANRAYLESIAANMRTQGKRPNFKVSAPLTSIESATHGKGVFPAIARTALGGASAATLGATDVALGAVNKAAGGDASTFALARPSATSIPEALVSGAVDFAGFLKGPVAVADRFLLGKTGKDIVGGVLGREKLVADSWKALGKMAYKSGITLGAASGMSSIIPIMNQNKPIADAVHEIGKSTVMGSTVGILYPASGLIENKALRTAMGMVVLDKVRELGGEATTVDVIKKIQNGEISNEEITQRAFSTVMDLYFFLHQPSAKNLLRDGRLRNLKLDEIKQVMEAAPEEVLNAEITKRQAWYDGVDTTPKPKTEPIWEERETVKKPVVPWYDHKGKPKTELSENLTKEIERLDKVSEYDFNIVTEKMKQAREDYNSGKIKNIADGLTPGEYQYFIKESEARRGQPDRATGVEATARIEELKDVQVNAINAGTAINRIMDGKGIAEHIKTGVEAGRDIKDVSNTLIELFTSKFAKLKAEGKLSPSDEVDMIKAEKRLKSDIAKGYENYLTEKATKIQPEKEAKSEPKEPVVKSEIDEKMSRLSLEVDKVSNATEKVKIQTEIDRIKTEHKKLQEEEARITKEIAEKDALAQEKATQAKIEAIGDNINDIPADMEIEVVKATLKSGKEIKETVNARKIIAERKADIDTFKNLLDCLKGVV